MLDSPLCIGGYSALPSANLLSLGIMQAGLPSALAKPQLCLWSFSCMFLSIVLAVFESDISLQKYTKIALSQKQCATFIASKLPKLNIVLIFVFI